MNSDVYVFGYQSMIAAGSLSTSVGAGQDDRQLTPARLKGYVRCWNAVRSFATNESKRYVHTTDWRVAERVAFATLMPSRRATVNGVCWRIPGRLLPDLDFREQGYARVDVSTDVSAYDGHELDRSIRCYTYIDPAPDPGPTMVSRSYYDMGRFGALEIGKQVSGFFDDYMSSTEPPAILTDELAFVFFSGDGHHLWLLEEADSSLALLHRFARAQFAPSTADPSEPRRLVTVGLKWLDARHRDLSEVSGHTRVPPAMVRDLVRNAAGEDVSGSAFWLCRLIAVDSPAISAAALAALASDADFWIRRAVQGRRASPA